jgi:transcriptional regulator with XRE-family HTH domain
MSMSITDHVDLLRARLLACRATREQVAQASGGVISSSWVSKFASGRMTNPRIDTLTALDQALNSLDREAA